MYLQSEADIQSFLFEPIYYFSEPVERTDRIVICQPKYDNAKGLRRFMTHVQKAEYLQ